MRTASLAFFLVAAASLAGCEPDRTPVARSDRAERAGEQPPAKQSSQPASQAPAQFAATLSPVSVVAGVKQFPLRDGPTISWQPVRPGITLTPSDAGMDVAYTRTRGKPAGAALMVRPGTLTDVSELTIRLSAQDAVTVNLCLTQDDGSVWSLSPLRISDGAVEVRRALADAEWDPYQNDGRTRTTFDPSKVYMITFLDLAGFMGGSESDLKWTVVSVKGGAR